MSKPWLLLDTATPIAVVGVWNEEGVLAEHRMSETRRHAEGLIDAIDRALLVSGVAMTDLAGAAVGRGPGSFIGVRTGIATAKGICLGRGLPLVGLPTLTALARSADTPAAPLPMGAGLVVIDAKRGEVFVQLVEKTPSGVRALDPPAALSPDEAAARARSLAFVVGARLEDAGHPCFVPLVAPTAQGLGAALAERLAGAASSGALDELDALVPDYCRPPDAKLPATDPSARRNLAGER